METSSKEKTITAACYLITPWIHQLVCKIEVPDFTLHLDIPSIPNAEHLAQEHPEHPIQTEILRFDRVTSDTLEQMDGEVMFVCKIGLNVE